MKITSLSLRKEKEPSDLELSEDELEIAQRHVANLANLQRPVPAEARARVLPRLRRIGRWLRATAERLSLGAEWARHVLTAPHHPFGRFGLRTRLWLKKFIHPPLLAALVVLVPAAVWRLVIQPPDGSPGYVVSSILFGAALVGAIAAAWGNLVRCPWDARRIRRRIARHPESVLPTTSPLRQAEQMARDERIPIVPREDLYDEILPGILDRRRSDVQMLVGEPGAGKTTALVGLAKELARTGIVPVVVPIWGKMPKNLARAAEERFRQHAWSLIGSNARLEDLWHWLLQQGRVVIAIDDVDRIAPDGERGYLLRRAVDELAGAGLPAVVTTRPAGIPAGLAATAIDLEDLDQKEAVDHVLQVAGDEPGSMTEGPHGEAVRGNLTRWVGEGRFAEVPFYLELLARLVAVEPRQELAPANVVLEEQLGAGRVRAREDGRCEWNPLWVRFRLLGRFYDGVVAGRVHRWLAIETDEREDCLKALSEAALATLAATAISARKGVQEDEERDSRRRELKRVDIQEFLKSDDRAWFRDGSKRRRMVSAREVVETGERLRILDRDPDGKLHFHHRIMQAYLAGRCLAARAEEVHEEQPEPNWLAEEESLDWVGALLDPAFPDRLTAHMTLTFAALHALKEREPTGRDRLPKVVEIILRRLIDQANEALPREDGEGDPGLDAQDGDRLDPRKVFHPERRRIDPDDALAKLTTAAEVARVASADSVKKKIVEGARRATGATMWTKLHAIPVIAALDVRKGWLCLWEFARDPDQEVRRAASEAIETDALAAYRALEKWINELLDRAALRSARGHSLESLEPGENGERQEDDRERAASRREFKWDTKDDIPGLRALGWVLPAIVSGLRENAADAAVGAPDGQGGGQSTARGDGAVAGAGAVTDEAPTDVRSPREALERFVKLAFLGSDERPELEAALAQGFKRDAMYHASNPNWSDGRPGLVADNRRLVADLCIGNADYWYAKLALYQTVALYAIAGSNRHARSNRQVAFDILGRRLRRGREPHPFVWRAAHLARRAVGRDAIGSDRWKALVWADEGVAVSRRPTEMNRRAAQLVADVTVLLNLKEGAPEDSQAHFPRMQELPYCLHGSRDRREILGAGCPEGCRYEFCPLWQPPPDEPNGQRTVSRAFCRGQYEIAGRRRLPWQRRIGRRALKRFWWQTERRART